MKHGYPGKSKSRKRFACDSCFDPLNPKTPSAAVSCPVATAFRPRNDTKHNPAPANPRLELVKPADGEPETNDSWTCLSWPTPSWALDFGLSARELGNEACERAPEPVPKPLARLPATGCQAQ